MLGRCPRPRLLFEKVGKTSLTAYPSELLYGVLSRQFVPVDMHPQRDNSPQLTADFVTGIVTDFMTGSVKGCTRGELIVIFQKQKCTKLKLKVNIKKGTVKHDKVITKHQQ